MHTSKFRFTLDLQTTQSQVSIPITLGDTGRTWYISFSDGSLPFALADGCLAKLEIKRPTGTFLEEFCPIENGTTVKYAFSQNENTAAVEGLHDCAVILYNTEGEMIGSPRFTMIVIDRVISSDDLNLSDENRTAIDAIIAAEASRQDAETGRINAEAERQNAEINRERNAAQIKTLIEENRFLPKIEEADNGKIVGVQAGMYVLLSGTGVKANPEEEATESLTKIMIGGTVYALPMGGGGSYETYGGEYEVIE